MFVLCIVGWLPLVMLVGKTVRLEQHFGIRFARCLGVRRRAIRHGRIKRGGRFRHVVGFHRHFVGRQRQCRLVGRWIAFRLHQHIGDGTRTRLRIGRAHQIIGQRSLSGLALPAPHMVFVRSDFAVKQHLGIIGNIGTLRIFGSQQRLPTLQRKISFTDLRTAIARIGARQLVHLLIAGIAGMTLDPYEFHRSGALGDFGIDRANQIRVLYRLLLRVLPAVLLPAVNPRGGTVDRILRIGFDHQRFGAGVRAQRLQHRAQLANLIGAVRSSAGIAVAVMVMPRLAACGKLMIGPTPTHRTIRIA